MRGIFEAIIDEVKLFFYDIPVMDIVDVVFGFICALVFMVLVSAIFGWIPILLSALGTRGILTLTLGWMIIVIIICIIA